MQVSKVENRREESIPPANFQIVCEENQLARRLSEVRINAAEDCDQVDPKEGVFRYPSVNEGRFQRARLLSKRLECHRNPILKLKQSYNSINSNSNKQHTIVEPRLMTVPVQDLSHCHKSNSLIHSATSGTTHAKHCESNKRTRSKSKINSIPKRTGIGLGLQRFNKIPDNKTAIRHTKDRKMSSRYGTSSNPARPVGFQDEQQRQPPNDGTRPERTDSNGAGAEGNTPQRSGNFTIIPPNQRRRNQIMSQREREAQAYQSYKESQRVNYVKTTPQSVGGTRSQDEIYRQRQREQQDKKYEMILKRQKWEREKKEREEAEYRAKKEKAREQTRRNEQKKAERQNAWTGDHIRKNEVFLRRLEQQSRQKQGQPSSSSEQYRHYGQEQPWSVD